MIVLDASAVIEVLMKSAMGMVLSGRLHAVRLAHAPHLVDIEVANVLGRQCSLGNLAQTRATQALEDFRKMRILRHRHTAHLSRIWELRDNFTSYDACYLALTEALGATLITRDKALRSARLRRGSIELV